MIEAQQVLSRPPQGRQLHHAGAQPAQKQVPAGIDRRPEQQGDHDTGNIFAPDGARCHLFFRRQQQRTAAQEKHRHGTAQHAAPHQIAHPVGRPHRPREATHGGGMDQQRAENGGGFGRVHRNIAGRVMFLCRHSEAFLSLLSAAEERNLLRVVYTVFLKKATNGALPLVRAL